VSLVYSGINYELIARELKLASVFVINNLNQSVNIQLVGCLDSLCNYSVPIGSVWTVSANSNDARTLTPGTSGWLPYITAQVWCSTAPSSGVLNVLLVKDRGLTYPIVSNLAITDTATHSVSTNPNNIFIVTW
jgi:hypothetical protein